MEISKIEKPISSADIGQLTQSIHSLTSQLSYDLANGVVHNLGRISKELDGVVYNLSQVSEGLVRRANEANGMDHVHQYLSILVDMMRAHNALLEKQQDMIVYCTIALGIALFLILRVF